MSVEMIYSAGFMIALMVFGIAFLILFGGPYCEGGCVLRS